MEKLILTGREAIRYARHTGSMLCKHGDPTEEARSGLTADEAEEIAEQDPGLIYVAVESDGDLLKRSDK